MKQLPKQVARYLRRNQTEAEKILWRALRNRKLAGKKFLRQHPIQFKYDNRRRFFVADFFCHETMLIIEVDGGIHEKQKDYDVLREHILNFLGFRIIRFKNEAIQNNLEKVLNNIVKYLQEHLSLSS
ncbi:MAG: DUF559 domain-containing protein [Candidatus Saganbacteria bacterium]|nr:DUF559 domain-containing protein [Candidatus Saganbacteria bacterium]